MKINLLLNNPNGVLSGYVNIDPFAQDDKERVTGDVGQLDQFVDDAEATEIIAMDILDYVARSDVIAVLTHWMKKLAHGGKLTVSGIDLKEVARAIYNSQLNVEEAQAILHGEQEQPWQVKRGSFSLPQIVDFFKSNGLNILTKMINNYKCIVVAERP